MDSPSNMVILCVAPDKDLHSEVLRYYPDAIRYSPSNGRWYWKIPGTDENVAEAWTGYFSKGGYWYLKIKSGEWTLEVRGDMDDG